MAQDLTMAREHRAEATQPPGLCFVHAQASRPTDERQAHGVPLFVGFGTPLRDFAHRAPPALEVSSWEHFLACVEPKGPFLSPAVKGFFANGGRLCEVLPVPPKQGAAGLQKVFDDNGVAQNVVDIDLVCVPDAVSAQAGAQALRNIQAAVLAHCEAMGDRFALLDAAPSSDGTRVDDLRGQASWHKSSFGALYAPWLHVGGKRAVPPCGHVAGVYARTDARAGVHKAPANETLEGAVATEWAPSDAEHRALNDAGVNCIRNAQGRGIRVWGARTLSGRSDWLYVPVARLFLALTRWLERNMDDIVFESHTPGLWQRVERRLRGYCLDLLEAGALAGGEPSSAFSVKCDAELNPPDSRDAGRLVAEVGLAVTVPAEFVVVRIVHDASGIVLIGP